ncbi:AhpC/TSA family protein [Terfezia boudieri ATCC MYA-4762]|uniref:AhpC/TSA family protein n=1 Tax=Terfezia boudieri ATCC MYA-4762 TaxID=1051890 RepID=A0A3N4MNT5_9PEZI|nr:AhpC/TSA family protein [Terfezia boudieri ATCC MYA-4762]
MQALRQALTLRSRAFSYGRRLFHANPRLLINVGDAIPDVEVQEGSPGNKLSIAKELPKGKALIIGVPGAFSPGCSAIHIPGYIKHAAKLPPTYVVTVNDSFVTKAWSENLPEATKSKIRFIADPSGKFTEAMGMDVDLSAFFGNKRSKRYVIIVEDGKVKEIFTEPDNTSVNVSKAENVLPSLG